MNLLGVMELEGIRKMRLISEINESDFDAEVLKSRQPVLVSFCAARSQPCQIMGPVLDEVAAGCNGRVKVVKVDVDDNPDLGMWYGIHSIPALLCFVNGEECSRIVGAAGGEAILARLRPVAGATSSIPEAISSDKMPNEKGRQ
jgi:thioredoxin 1